MTDDDNDKYTLNRSEAERKRLEVQHRLWVDNIGYTLHPTIVSALPTQASIADIGTGTGAFLLELSTQLPSTTALHGFDYSPAMFPSPANLPSSPPLHLHIHDAKTPFPAAFHGAFDAVHIRLLVCAMDSQEDWSRVARNAAQLLKPGGHMQWAEGNFTSLWTPLRDAPTASTARLRYWLDRLAPTLPRSRLERGWSNLRRIFAEELGLEDVREDVCSSDRVPELRAVATQMEVDLFTGLLPSARNGLSEEERGIAEREIRADVESGAYYRWDMHVFVGRKPGVG